MDPPSPPIHAIRKLLAGGEPEESLLLAKRATAEWPANADLFFLRGIAEAALGRLADARASMEHAMAIAPAVPWNWSFALVNVLRDSGDLDAAKEAGERLLLQAPDRAEAHNAHGLTLRAIGATTEAINAFRSAIGVNPQYVLAYGNLASALDASGQAAAAIDWVRRGLQLNATSHELYVTLGNLLAARRRFDDAKDAFATAIRLNPSGSFDALRRLGRIAYEQADIFSAINAYESALKLQSNDVELWIWLGNAYLDVGAISQAKRCFGEALERKPDYAEVYDTLLVCRHYDPNFDPQEMFAAHREWQRRYARSTTFAHPAVQNGNYGRRRTRLGFVSRSMAGGAPRYFLPPLLRHLDRNVFAVHCYNAGRTTDAEASSVARHCDAWRDIGGRADEELIRMIRSDAIDILIELDGHVPGNRLRALSAKPAPVQITWLDYFDTTGSDAFDFLIGDKVSTPEGGSQLFTEKIILIDPCRLCYEAPSYAPDLAPPPLFKNGHLTFGSFNRLSKLAEPVLDQWAALLRAIPTSRLILKNAAFAHPTTRSVFAQRFVLRGIDAHRLDLRGPSEHVQMLAEYGDVDIALDPFPYNGGLTTCEALFMGLPIIAMTGSSMISRQTAALLGAAGLARWIASSASDWLSLNLALAADPEGLRSWRKEAREVLRSSALMAGPAFAREFARALRACTH